MTAEEREDLIQKRFEQLKSKGIPIDKVHFNYPVRGENHFATKDVKPTRQAELTVTSAGVLVEQKGKRPILVPDGNWYWGEF